MYENQGAIQRNALMTVSNQDIPKAQFVEEEVCPMFKKCIEYYNTFHARVLAYIFKATKKDARSIGYL